MPVSGARPRSAAASPRTRPITSAPATIAARYRMQPHSAFQNAGPVRDSPHVVLRRAQQDRKEESSMSHRMNAERFLRAIAAAGLAAGAALTAAPAQAGSCPADQVKPGVRAAGETTPKGVTDTVLGQVDLAS